jgi:hypothetical protein
MAGLCGVVKWEMEGAYAHLVSTSGVLGFALSLVNALVVSDSGNTLEDWVASFLKSFFLVADFPVSPSLLPGSPS